MKIRMILMTSVCFAVSPISWVQSAEQCTVAPTCGELGYEQKESDCNGQYMLRCPFDKSKVFCGGLSCSYTATTKPSGCSIINSCVKNGTTYYSDICSICYAGYSLDSQGKCQQTCMAEQTSNEGCASYDSCQRETAQGISTYYKCHQCKDGYFMMSESYGCWSCEKKCNYDYVRTSAPYTEEECQSLSDNVRCVEVGSFECMGKTYYGCGTSCAVITCINPEL